MFFLGLFVGVVLGVGLAYAFRGLVSKKVAVAKADVVAEVKQEVGKL
jgi:Na+/H+-translocating membrane pyrophosphatase